jgi:hypothetical protein
LPLDVAVYLIGHQHEMVSKWGYENTICGDSFSAPALSEKSPPLQFDCKFLAGFKNRGIF